MAAWKLAAVYLLMASCAGAALLIVQYWILGLETMVPQGLPPGMRSLGNYLVGCWSVGFRPAYSLCGVRPTAGWHPIGWGHRGRAGQRVQRASEQCQPPH
jgi:hypothetical protein